LPNACKMLPNACKLQKSKLIEVKTSI